jgi:hypothetical protein
MMVRKPILCLFAGFACVAAAFTTQAQKQKLMSDPLFGISYDPQSVKFEEAPARIRMGCSQVHTEKTWVYCHLKTAEIEYFIVSGLIRQCPDGPGPCDLQPDVTGAIVALRGSTCSAEAADGFYWRKSDSLYDLPEASLGEMARDALQRYAKAFGGKKNFLNKLTPRTRGYLEPVLRKQLETFEKDPGE